jgi:drug/metabolite transporter (DMT)-like permease
MNNRFYADRLYAFEQNEITGYGCLDFSYTVFSPFFREDSVSLKNMRKALFQLHISVFLAGFTGVLGKLIHLNEALLVWYRIAITVGSLWLLLAWKKQLVKIPLTRIFSLAGIGSLIALHWVCFYGSIRMSNVSIGLVCFASIGLFTAILEPLFTRKKFSLPELGLGMLSLLGILLIFHFDTRYRTGIITGIFSAAIGALFSVLNKKQVSIASPQTIMLYELGGGLLVLTVGMPVYLHFFPVNSLLPSAGDWGWLLVLSWLCTVLAMNLMLQALQKVSAFTQNLSMNLEPVYGIILAFLLFHENKNIGTGFYVGVALIGLSVILQMMRVNRQSAIVNRKS